MNKLFIVIIILLFSCRAEKRIARFLDRHPELKENDTIYFKDTIIREEVRADTVLIWDSIQGDTVVIQKDNLEIKTIIRDQKIYIEGKCKGDTVFIDRKIPFEKIKYIKENPFGRLWKKTLRILPWILGLILILIILAFIKKHFL